MYELDAPAQLPQFPLRPPRRVDSVHGARARGRRARGRRIQAGGEQAAGVGVLRLEQHCRRRPGLDDGAIVHHQYPIGAVGGDCEVLPATPWPGDL
ncbi:hypothetical protein [Candidatus Frankia alpina]|uniref:hypothetical protein n=1 Tax=Candidatus Frankia alpina TaxID=2699483 RepID=UPI0013D5830A|nr:hypothetical protein [Candidatus Frankia alpina]